MNCSYDNYTNILKGKYKKKFEQVDEYCTLLLDNIDSSIKNDIMVDIIDIFQDAQHKQLPIDSVIGDDIESFCEHACSDLPRRYKVKYIFELFKYCSWVLLIFNSLELIFNYENNSILNIKTNIGSFIIPIFMCLLVATIYRVINKKTINRDSKLGLFTKLLLFICIVITCLLSIISSMYLNIKVPVLIIISLSIFIIISYSIIYRKDSRINSDYIYTATHRELVNSNEHLKALNKKNKKKGKDKITEDEYIDIEIEKISKSLRYNKFNLVVPIIFSMIATSFNIFDSNIVDSLLFFFIILIIEYIIFIPTYINTTKYNNMLLEKYTYFKEKEIPIKKWK